MKSIELFAGAGGLGLGVSRAGFTPIDIVEWDKWCCDTLRENRSRGTDAMRLWPLPREEDVRHLSFLEFEGKLDLVAGGPPCQPFSLGGCHRGQLDNRDMWPQAVRVIRETKPKAFIFENVKGLTRTIFQSYFSYIFLQLSYPEIAQRTDEHWIDHRRRLEQHHTSGSRSGLVYQVLPPKVLNAADYGVPQKRERVFFVGFRSDLGVQWSFPHPSHSREALLWSQFRGGDYWDRHKVAKKDRSTDSRSRIAASKINVWPQELPWRTTRDALHDLPDPELNSASTCQISDHRFQPGARIYPGHTGSPIDEPAKTLKAGVHGVPGGENMLRRADGSVRYFSVREGARLQTFPDDYVFHGAWSEIMRQLGNAVPVALAQVIAESVKQHLQQNQTAFKRNDSNI